MKCRGAIIYYNYVQAISPDYKEIFLLIAASLIAQLVESTCNSGDPGLIPGSGRSAGKGIGYPL